MKWAIDLILLGVFLLCCWNGYKRGLIMGVGGIVSIMLSLYVACLLSGTFSYEVVPVVKPFASGFAESVMANDVAEKLGMNYTQDTPLADRYSINDMVGTNTASAREFAVTTYQCLGIYESAAEQMADEALERSMGSKVSLKQAVVDVLCDRAVYVAGVILCFLIILIFLTFIGNLTNLSFRLPNMEMADEIGGTVLGVVKGILFCMLLAWALKFLGIIIGPDTMETTLLGRVFIKIGFIAHFIGI